MGVYIPKVEIADNCLDCCFNYDQLFCMPLERKTPDVGKPDWCPLVEVPEPHGKLIDADAFADELVEGWYVSDEEEWKRIIDNIYEHILPMLNATQTVIEGSDE